MRVAALGLDAMEWDYVEPLLRQGALPNMAALADAGVHCRLRNVREYRSELPWTQFITGRRANDTGYWTTVEFDPATYETWARGAHHGEPFWRALPASSRSIIFDVPHTSLDHPVEGVHVTAWGAHSPQYLRASRPRGLLTEIDVRFGPHPAFERDYEECWFDDEYMAELADALVEGAGRRLDIVEWLMATNPGWDLLLTVMSETHSVGHHSWHGVDDGHLLAAHPSAVGARRHTRRVYEEMDRAIGRFLEAVPSDAAALVFSLHGMQSNTNDLTGQVLVPELLYRLETGRRLLGGVEPGPAWRQAGFPIVMPPEAESWTDMVKASVERSPARRLARVLRGARNQGRPRFADRAIPGESRQSVGDLRLRRASLAWQPSSWYRSAWPRMRAFAIPTFSDPHVRINLRGREVNGVVELEDYDVTCKEITEMLHQCTHARTGQPVIDEVVAVRDDPLDPEGPTADLVVLFSRVTDAIEHPAAGLIGPFPLMRTGEHSSNGFAFARVPGREPRDLGERSALDVPPTILDLLGVEPSAGISGSSLLAREPALR